jgi:hypothetical protein
MIDTKRKIIAGVLIAVMAALAIVLVVKGKDLFTQTITITYPDGCVEIIKGDNLTTPICTKGRLLKELAEEQQIENSWKTSLINVSVK